jgi:taurine dioxygenase
MDVRSLKNFGAEITDVDMAKTQTQQTIARMRGVWAQNGVLLFRDQQLQERDVVAFSRLFGDLEIHIREEYLSKENPELLIISNVKENGEPIGILSDHEVGWHHDQIYLPRPALGSLLYSFCIPPSGGNTLFCDLASAYETLPKKKQRNIDTLRAIHSYEYFNRQWSEPTNDTQKKRSPDVTHPLVRTHPVSGRKAIYADPGMTAGIEGMGQDEAQTLLSELYEWCLQPQFIYEHEWRLGDAIMWDNASTMHKRGDFDPKAERIMKRTTILPPPDRAVPI